MEEDFKIDFIGIGAEKCATTWIFECLKEHPQVCVGSKKEIRFFEKSYNYRKGLKYYKSYFEHCESNKIKGEFSPGYLYHSKSAQRIYNDFPYTKIIACLRNPAERAFSQYQADVKLKGPLSIYDSFEKALIEREHLIERGFYYRQLKRYFDLFPRDNILVLIYDDLKKDSLSFIQSVYRFLGVDENFVPLLVDKRKGPTGSVIRKTKLPFLNYFFQKTAYWARSNNFLYNLLDRIGVRSLRLRLMRANQKKIFKDKLTSSVTDSINPNTREKLVSIYEPGISKLEKLINRNLNQWKKISK